jgi:hypothetical protein
MLQLNEISSTACWAWRPEPGTRVVAVAWAGYSSSAAWLLFYWCDSAWDGAARLFNSGNVSTRCWALAPKLLFTEKLDEPCGLRSSGRSQFRKASGAHESRPRNWPVERSCQLLRRSISHFCAYNRRLCTLNAFTGRLNPLRTNSSVNSVSARISTALCTLMSIRICPFFASSQSREARFATLPVTEY